jgi:type VI secretion system protein ImpA
VVNLEDLLAPISDEAPAGDYLRPEGFYGQIDEARSAEARLPLGKWKRKLKSADWPRVIALTSGALTKRTKDLHIAVRLAEALVKVHGFAGLRDGLALVRELHERFWDDMYPPVEDGDLNTRATRITWLVEQLGVAVKEVPLTKGFKQEAYSYFDWKSSTGPAPADEDEQEPDEDEDKEELVEEAAARITAEQWRAAANATSAEFYAQTLQLIDDSTNELSALDRLLDERFAEERNGQIVKNSPAVKPLKDALAEVADLVTRLSRKKRPQKQKKGAAVKKATPGADGEGAGRPEGARSEETAADAPAGLSADASDEDADEGRLSGPVRSREEALRRLGEVADYFRRAEPHSPVSYLVERAIKWGRMPLDAWLEDVLGEESVLGKVRETLGLKRVTADPAEAESEADEASDNGEDEEDE